MIMKLKKKPKVANPLFLLFFVRWLNFFLVVEHHMVRVYQYYWNLCCLLDYYFLDLLWLQIYLNIYWAIQMLNSTNFIYVQLHLRQNKAYLILLGHSIVVAQQRLWRIIIIGLFLYKWFWGWVNVLQLNIYWILCLLVYFIRL